MYDHQNYDKVKAGLTTAFKDLRKKGYFARQNFTCCQSCACAAIPAGKEVSYVFYHNQDNQTLREKGETYLAWNGDGREIVKTLLGHGLAVRWDGSDAQRILVGF